MQKLWSITLSDLRFHAYHGVLEQERIVGGDYSVSLSLYADLSEAALSDDVNGTINYSTVADIVEQEMHIPSALLERVAYRIADRLLRKFPQLNSVDIAVTKLAPPITQPNKGATINLKCTR